MIITTKTQLQTYKKAALLSTKILAQLRNALKPGIYPIEIDQLAAKLCQKHNVKAAFKGVKHKDKVFNYSTCISINHTVVHGVPSSTRKIQVGDIVKVDFGIIYQGFYTDHCFTVAINQTTPQTKKLILATKKAVQAAIPKAITDNTVGDLGHTMQTIAVNNGFDVLKQYTGHSLGKTLHEPPTIPAHGKPHAGNKLKKGLVICLEAQLVTGSDKVIIDKDGWSVSMADKGLTAMFEYMVVVQDKNPILLTPTLDWPIVV